MKGCREEDLRRRRERLAAAFPVWECRTIYDRFCRTEEKYGDSRFFADEDRIWTYREEKERAEQAAGAFAALGVKQGCKVAICMANREEYIPITFGLARLGAVKVPVNRGASFDEMKYILEQTGTKVLVLENGAGGSHLGELEQIGCLEKVIRLDGEAQGEKEISWENFFRLGQGEESPAVSDGGLLSDIIYTSGSTGTPKGVMLTHDMLLRSAWASCLNRGFEPGWSIYVPLPLFHVYGYVEGLLAAVLCGGSVMVTRGKVEAVKALKVMEAYGANDILSVPLIMMKILRCPELKEYPLKSLKAVYCSASICPSWVWSEIREKIGAEEVITGYGMTEVCGASMQTDPLDGEEILRGRAGRILSGGAAGMDLPGRPLIQYRVLDPETGKDAGPGVCGELVCRGPVVTEGYYRFEEATRKAMTPDGWLRTGDLGWFDENGYLRLMGRGNDTYKINGENVSPQFLDRIISRCRAVKDVETVGVRDERKGWVGAAFVDVGEGGEEAERLVRDYCRENLAPYQVPDYFFFGNSGDWPRTSTGKAQKFRLRELADKLVKEGYGRV